MTTTVLLSNLVTQKTIDSWIEDLLSIPNPAFANLPPCPYAKAAWIGKSYCKKICKFQSVERGYKIHKRSCNDFLFQGKFSTIL